MGPSRRAAVAALVIVAVLFLPFAASGCSPRTEQVKSDDYGHQPGYGSDRRGDEGAQYPKRCPNCARGHEASAETCAECQVALEPWQDFKERQQ